MTDHKDLKQKTNRCLNTMLLHTLLKNLNKSDTIYLFELFKNYDHKKVSEFISEKAPNLVEEFYLELKVYF